MIRALNLKTPRANRTAALALLGIVIIALAAAIVVPTYLAHEHYDFQNAKMSRQLNAYTTLNQTRPTLLRSVEVLRTKDAKKFYLKGATPALAAAELQDVVKAIIEGNGGRTLSTQAGASKEDNGYRQIASKMQISVNIQNLRRILYALENKEPYLFVDGLIVRSSVFAGFKPAPGVEPDLYVEFDVVGYTPMAPVVSDATSPATTTSRSSTAATVPGGKI
jgi:general secretion pathway protein M